MIWLNIDGASFVPIKSIYLSKFLHERDIADCLEYSNELDVIKYAKAVIKNIDNYSIAFREQSDTTK